MGNNPSVNSLSETNPLSKAKKHPKIASAAGPKQEPPQPKQNLQNPTTHQIPATNSPKEVFVCQKVVDFNQDFLMRFRLSHPNLLRTLGFDLSTNYFSNGNFPMGENIYFEYAPKSLQHLLKDRKPNKLLSDGDMRAFFKDTIEVLSFLQELDIAHGDIDTSTVFFDESQEVFKIYDQELLAGANSGFCLTKQQVKKSFLSPELLYAFVSQPNIVFLEGKYFKADVFSLGMVFLEVGSLQDSVELYDYQRVSINKQILNERLGFMSQFFSPDVVSLIAVMLEFDEKRRPDFIELRNMLIYSEESNPQQQYNYNTDMQQKPQYIYPVEVQNYHNENTQNKPNVIPHSQQNFYANQQLPVPELVYQQQAASHIKIKKNSISSQSKITNEEPTYQQQTVVRPSHENLETNYQQQQNYLYNNGESQVKKEIVYVPVYHGPINPQSQITPNQQPTQQEPNPQQSTTNEKAQMSYGQNKQYIVQAQAAYNQLQHDFNKTNNLAQNPYIQSHNLQIQGQNPNIQQQQQIPANLQQSKKVFISQQVKEEKPPAQQEVNYNVSYQAVGNYATQNQYQSQNYESNDSATYGELRKVQSIQQKPMVAYEGGQYFTLEPPKNLPVVANEDGQYYHLEPKRKPQNSMPIAVNENYNIELSKKAQNNLPYMPQVKYVESFNSKATTVSFVQNPVQKNNENQMNFQQENKAFPIKTEDKETKESLERLRMEIMNSKKIIENYEKNKKTVETTHRKPFNEMLSFGNNNNNNNIEKTRNFKVEQPENSINENASMSNLKIAHKTIIERNKKLDERLEEVLRKSQAITKGLNN